MHAKRIGRLTGFAILAASFVAANSGTATAIAGDVTISYEDSDAAMNTAQSQARGSLNTFFSQVLSADGQLLQDAGVKVAVPTADGVTEVIWVNPFAKDNNGFVGLLANDPNNFPGAAGDRITFTEDQVRDWYVFGANGKMYGNYTTRVMLPDLSAELAAQITAMLSPTPMPETW